VRAALLLLAACHTNPTMSRPPKSILPLPRVVKGANLRPVGDERRTYGSSTARQTMVRLKGLGVNTIGVLMEGRMEDRDDVEILAPRKAVQEDIVAVLLDARALGLATILVPHIYVNDGTWRGEIAFADGGRRTAWWRSYSAFMDVAAEVASNGGASMLSIGVELKAMSKDADTRGRMIGLADRIRKEFGGELTYSANWDEAEAVSFWDAVDVVGINGYYPLEPDPIRGAEAIGRRLGALAQKTQREVVVLEVGYRSSPLSHERPWEWVDHVEAVVDVDSQAVAWAAILTHWLDTPGVRGLMVWVVPTDPDDPASEPRHGFNPLNKPAEQIIGRAFHAAP
jgi:hypothetical protein